MINIPDKIEKTLYFHYYVPDNYVTFLDFKVEDDSPNFIFLFSYDLEIDVPKDIKILDITNSAINNLKNKIKENNAKCHVENEQIQQQINELLALEHIE